MYLSKQIQSTQTCRQPNKQKKLCKQLTNVKKKNAKKWAEYSCGSDVQKKRLMQQLSSGRKRQENRENNKRRKEKEGIMRLVRSFPVRNLVRLLTLSPRQTCRSTSPQQQIRMYIHRTLKRKKQEWNWNDCDASLGRSISLGQQQMRSEVQDSRAGSVRLAN